MGMMNLPRLVALLLSLLLAACDRGDASAPAGLQATGVGAGAGTGGGPVITPELDFPVVEATLAQVHSAMLEGRLDCATLVQRYLQRITAYDRAGPQLQSIITVSPRALDDAAALDSAFVAGGLSGPLHCAPVLLKDNVDTADIPTTAGSLSLETSQPPDDAFLVQQLRAAGALILGKANMDEFAFGFTGSSSLGGLIRNPYDPTRGAGGSSSGTGASIGASLGLFGIGTDTGGSIRVPSSVQGLVGIRPSMRLISQDGIIPLAHFQDTAGPMCRTVEDCALMLTVISGFDSSSASGQNTLPLARDDQAVLIPDAMTYRTIIGFPSGPDYTLALNPMALNGARIGVVRALFGSNTDVVGTINAALAAMTAAGAIVEDVTVPELSTITGYASVSKWEFRDHLTEYLTSWPSDEDGHKRSFEEVAASGEYEQSRAASFATNAQSGVIRYQDPDYDNNTLDRPAIVRARLNAALDHTDLNGNVLGEPYDLLLYPSVQSPPAVGGAPSTGSNNRLSPFSGFPALSMPAGFTAATADRVALPIGMEMLGREFDEATLIRIAYAYQQLVRGTALARQAPTFTPEMAALGPAARTASIASRQAPLIRAPEAKAPATAPTELERN